MYKKKSKSKCSKWYQFILCIFFTEENLECITRVLQFIKNKWSTCSKKLKNRKRNVFTDFLPIVITGIIVLGLLIWAIVSPDVCVLNLLTEHRIPILAITITVAVLGFSTYFSLRTYFIYQSRIAKVNADTNEKWQTKKEWCRLAKNYDDLAELRTYSANLCFYVMLGLIITLAVAILFGKLLQWLPLYIVSLIPLVLSIIPLYYDNRDIANHEKLPKCFRWARCPVPIYKL